jgi:hypothetical protein
MRDGALPTPTGAKRWRRRRCGAAEKIGIALGWVLGPIRVLWAVPHFGRLTPLLFEAVIMLIAMFISARWVIRRFDVGRSLPATTAGMIRGS